MLGRAIAMASLLLSAACTAAPPATPAANASLVLPTTVPNGRVEVVVKRSYGVGEVVRATIRLLPTSGTLRGPIGPLIQASGFHGTGTVKQLDLAAATATAAAPATVDVTWDMHDDSGAVVGSDDYSLVFTVQDDAGRSTSVGATLQVR
jgi:hypothetical protein